MKQTELQRKAFNRELAVMLFALLLATCLSWLWLSKPSIDEISRDIFDTIPTEQRDVFLVRANRLLTADPTLAADPDRWERELTRLVMR